MENTNQIQALRKIMYDMSISESTTRRAKEIALEVRRLEKSCPQNDPQSVNNEPLVFEK
jgi:hypothetical protein